MSRYRSDIEVVRLRVQQLQERLRRVRAELILVEADANLGPRARRPFSRFMYHLGRALGRQRRRPQGSSHELTGARARLVWLEQRVAEAEAALSRATHEAAARARASDAPPSSTPTPQGTPPRSMSYALGRSVGRIRRR
ncbi:hypothetical protein BE17_10140 [Sorangium cellulosum]|uniref:Uncharacterized protein n=1 Tax=Sorangium cellulosum TaxID=56 RepID=A0A150RTN0_SORCE|nr:hypothetical protein BE17_10140 [Sorangium cellulosum]